MSTVSKPTTATRSRADLDTSDKRGLGPRQQELVSALRSGKFKQGCDVLSGIDHESGRCFWCPLGIMTELYRLEHPDECDWLTTDGVRFLRVKKDSVLSPGDTHLVDYTWSAPEEVLDWFHLSDSSDNMAQRLLDLNDTCKLSFTEIADELEGNPGLWFEEEV